MPPRDDQAGEFEARLRAVKQTRTMTLLLELEQRLALPPSDVAGVNAVRSLLARLPAERLEATRWPS